MKMGSCFCLLFAKGEIKVQLPSTSDKNKKSEN